MRSRWFNTLKFIMVSCTGMGVLSFSLMSQAGSTDLAFSANITGGGTCQVAVNNGNRLTLGPGDLPTSSALGLAWPQLGKTSFPVTLSGCPKLGGVPGKTASLTVVGDVLPSKGDSRLFHDASSAASGFGIVFYSDPNTAAGTEPQIQNNMPVGVAAQGVVMTDKTLTWAAAVSCGATAAECTPDAANTLSGGALLATVTLTFTYE